MVRRPSPIVRVAKRRLWSTIALVAVALTTVSCSGDGTAVAYLESVADGNRRMEAETFAALPAGVTPTRDGIAGVVEARRDAYHRLRALEPPGSLQLEHEALVITLGVLVDESDRFMARTVDLDDHEFAEAAVAAVDLDLLAEAVARSCRALQDRASEAGHEVDLRC